MGTPEADDPPKAALQQRLLGNDHAADLSGLCSSGLVYMAFGEPRAGLIPWGYGLVSSVGLATARWTGRYGLFRAIQLGMWLVLPFLLQIELGGFVPGSVVSVWAFCAPISALLSLPAGAASTLMVVFALLVVAAVFVQPLAGTSNALPAWLVAALFGLNLVGTAVVTDRAMVFFIVAEGRGIRSSSGPSERDRSACCSTRSPAALIADRRKQQEPVIADRFDAVSVLFADIVGFTPLSVGMSAEESSRDARWALCTAGTRLTQRRGLEKIRTIGDADTVAAGVPALALTTRRRSSTSAWTCCRPRATAAVDTPSSCG